MPSTPTMARLATPKAVRDPKAEATRSHPSVPGRRVRAHHTSLYPSPRTVTTSSGLRRILLDLAAQPPDVGVHEPGVAEVVVAPHLLEQLLPAQHETAVLHAARTAAGTPCA